MTNNCHHPKKLSELYPSIASTNGFKNISKEVGERLDPHSPLSEILKLTLSQTVEMMGTLEKIIEENDLEKGTDQNPGYPEDRMIIRLNEFKKELYSLEEFLNGTYYQPHPHLPDTFRLETPNQDLYPAIQINFKSLDLPQHDFIEPDWYGLTLPQLKQVLCQADNVSRARQSAEQRFYQNEKRLQEVTSSWEKAAPATLKIVWGRVTGYDFIAQDTHLEIDIAYSAEDGYVATPKLIMKTAETKAKEIKVVAIGEPFPIMSFNGIPGQNINRVISEALKI